LASLTLDEVAQWDRILSGGELQRLAFARSLLHQPEWIFMDEATAALDEESQTSMMELFREQLAWTTVVSVAHRAGLAAFHDRTLELVKSDSGARLVVRRRMHGTGPTHPPRAKLRQRLTRSFAARVVRRKAKSAP
jgi:putative ATP-binding cassette transporter